MKKLIVFSYGVICYLIGAGAYFIGLVGFSGNFLGYYSVDSGPETSLIPALLINIGLIVLFGLPHSLMARSSFKQWWTKIIPPAAERSTYMLQSGLLALLLIWQWRPITQIVWHVENPLGSTLIWGLFWLGWLIAAIATWLINHFELTGLQQVYAYVQGKEPTPPNFRTPFLYKIVRHPMQLGVTIAFWATPHMTVGHLLFAVGMTAYILIGLYFEERDLVRRFGDTYRAYQRRTPKLIPVPRFQRVKEGRSYPARNPKYKSSGY
jgi:protein-S-isoprenylcysteine O-methyltransferase Ste14